MSTYDREQLRDRLEQIIANATGVHSSARAAANAVIGSTGDVWIVDRTTDVSSIGDLAAGKPRKVVDRWIVAEIYAGPVTEEDRE